MTDSLASIGHTLIQHGPNSDRVYLIKLDPRDLPGLLDKLDQLTQQHGYTKVFAKVPAPHEALFLDGAYEREGFIPGFYKGETDAAFLGKFLDPQRRVSRDRGEIDAIVSLALSKGERGVAAGPSDYQLRCAGLDDAVALAELYGQVFASYPFPIDDPRYVAETMQEHVLYFVAEQDGKIVAAASCEMDPDNLNVEMTDFATLPAHRGHGLAVSLLLHMEPEMVRLGMRTLYTIARAISPGMNITFARCGYAYAGTLINNTQISGSIESMNLWYRSLSV
jgi:putative beta-lysine N-acetyltransferase